MPRSASGTVPTTAVAHRSDHTGGRYPQPCHDQICETRTAARRPAAAAANTRGVAGWGRRGTPPAGRAPHGGACYGSCSTVVIGRPSVTAVQLSSRCATPDGLTSTTVMLLRCRCSSLIAAAHRKARPRRVDHQLGVPCGRSVQRRGELVDGGQIDLTGNRQARRLLLIVVAPRQTRRRGRFGRLVDHQRPLPVHAALCGTPRRRRGPGPTSGVHHLRPRGDTRNPKGSRARKRSRRPRRDGR